MLCTVAYKAYQAHLSHWAYQSVLQKVVFEAVKGGLLACERPPFRGQKTAFCNAVCKVLIIRKIENVSDFMKFVLPNYKILHVISRLVIVIPCLSANLLDELLCIYNNYPVAIQAVGNCYSALRRGIQ